MYFNSDKNDTNIDNEFKQQKNILSTSSKKINKYIFLIIIPIIVILLIAMIYFFANRELPTYLTLDGEEIITIYQGSDYIEPGYKAYNSKDEDLSSNVEIKSTLNTDKVGEYEIIYTLGDISKVRKINVIAKSASYTYIYLKTVNNSVNVYLKVGEKYTEPGYQVFNSEGLDLTSQVKVTGSVDTSKRGNYKLTYSVVDPNNVTVSASRTVIVMDTEISLSLNNENYTNGKVSINAMVTDNYFDYMILPNNTKITQSTYIYDVSENGTYKFIVYNKKGTKKEASIEVKNINKTVPTGSCSGSYKDEVSTINITATDDIGISKYMINGVSYTQNKITLTGELEKVNIIIYDKAGNAKNISCNLEDKNPKVKDDIIYTQERYHDNSINGIRYILYNQSDPRWNDMLYSGSNTFGYGGCVGTSVAVVMSAYDNTFKPTDVPPKHRHAYPSNTINSLSDESFSCNIDYNRANQAYIKNVLSQGKIVIIEVTGPKAGGYSKFTGRYHEMALIDYDKKNDRIFVGNAYATYTYGRNGWFDATEVLTSVNALHICTPSQELINKFK